MESNADRLREMFDRFWGERDLNAGRDVLSENIVWRGLNEAALDGDRHGLRAVSKFFAEWLDAWDDYDNQVEIHELTPDLIVTESRFSGRGKGSGIEFETQLGQVWEFEAGKVVRQTMYRTYDEAVQAAKALTHADAS
jgi:ketosteroid isomerase-like protein